MSSSSTGFRDFCNCKSLEAVARSVVGFDLGIVEFSDPGRFRFFCAPGFVKNEDIVS